MNADNPSLKGIRAIVFDWDNTIVDSFHHLVVFHREVGHRLGWPPITDEDIKAVWGKPFDELIQALWPGHDGTQFALAYQRYILDQTVPIIKGADGAVAKLKRSYLLGIVTAAPRFEVEHFLACIGLDKGDFFVLQTSDDSDSHKPDPRVFEPVVTALREKNTARSEVLYVGDSLADFYAARDAGLQFAAVLTGCTGREQFQAAGVDGDRILSSVAALPERLAVDTVEEVRRDSTAEHHSFIEAASWGFV